MRGDGSRLDTPVRRFLDILKVLAEKNLRARYRGSYLGVLWSLSNPLLMTVVYTVIFGTAFGRYYGGSGVRYFLACFCGLVVLQYFAQATTQALTSLVDNGSLLNKIALPIAAFPLAVVAANSFQFVISTLPLLAVLALVTSHDPLNALALLVPVFGLFLAAVGFGYIVSALYVFFRDLQYLYELLLFVFWITSPIFYPADLVPASVRPILSLNPLAVVMGSIRQISLSGTWPDVGQMLHALLAGVLAFVAGIGMLWLVRDDVMDLL